ncbi:Adh7p [Malassezia vespertilionis]|uniref:alcohol dehydrogenase (NADP(+)) n=1 Tax=Malassezia vespertilionis TaxID=2020962 RepID=A0A2N1JFW5_9BASI|nr:Adh7p [Malassezia vespertilionis]
MPKGYAIKDVKNWTDFQVIDFDLKKPADDDIDIAITHYVDCIGDGEGYMVDTYNSIWPDGSIAQGGYSTNIRTPEQFVFPIPDGMKSEHAAPMLCAGLTLYSPLRRNNVGPGKRVGIVGIGGLGHFGVMFAKAMDAEVIAISHSASKKEDALKMGASQFIATKEDPNWFERFKNKPFDLIVNTASSAAVDIPAMISALKVDGSIISVGMPEDLIQLRVQNLAMRCSSIGSSHIGSKVEAMEMLKLANEKNVVPWIELIDMKDCSKAIERVSKGDIRYRFVLKQDLEKPE